ncbi:hypothetical protein [Nannocystis punicea]|uniref:Uncharacterized protein n=1 Tax=Nannocystis punicea TaxID=2995304 RepID=A0ABY7H2I1_9BACT|nr:hypothetical protein [Nannocystis poenicansa]WAS93443.1 hypothetical protein O0S08_45495 [Nannocystis poenicansa]
MDRRADPLNRSMKGRNGRDVLVAPVLFCGSSDEHLAENPGVIKIATAADPAARF